MKINKTRRFIKVGAKYTGLLFCGWLMVSCTAASERPEGMPEHHTADGFRNISDIPTSSSKGVLFVLRRIWGSAFHPDVPDVHVLPEEVAVNNLKELEGEDTLTWLGQSTFLLRINGVTILTDPFLTNRASPVSFVGGVTRYTPPGMKIESLPKIDMIVISHNHYDHLDFHTIDALPNKAKIHVGVPLGVSELFEDAGYKNIYELDWNESITIGDIRLEALPAVHDSGRWLVDKNKSLWASWGIFSPSGKYYFGGDTGYSSAFKQAGDKYQSFDMALLPIGAYSPYELMWMSHVTPEQAIKAGQDLNADILVAGHWGTIGLSDEDHWEPPKRFLAAAEKAGIDKEKAWVMKIGETRILPKKN